MTFANPGGAPGASFFDGRGALSPWPRLPGSERILLADATGLLHVIALTGAAGLMIPLGGALGYVEHLRPGHLRRDLLKAAVAFGGGALLAAATLVLIPQAVEGLPPFALVAGFLLGAAGSLALFQALVRHGTKAGELLAMILEFVPESVALGTAAAVGDPLSPLLALLIGAQNLPEAFNSFRDLTAGEHSRGHVLLVLSGLAAVGPAAGVAGYVWLSPHPTLSAGVMATASGGIVALLFQDVIPSAKRRGHVVPTWGGLLGFTVGLVGFVLLH